MKPLPAFAAVTLFVLAGLLTAAFIDSHSPLVAGAAVVEFGLGLLNALEATR